MKILFYSTHQYELPFLQNIKKENIELVFTAKALSIKTALLAKNFDAVALFTSDNAAEDVLEILHNNGIKFIALRSVGYDHIDLKKAKQLNIKVANVPAYSPYAIAEHAVALILALNRKIVSGQKLIEQNNFCLDTLVGFDVYGKKIGIIGTGKTGSAFAKIMHGFGCKLLGFDVQENKSLVQETNIVYTSFNEVCKDADIISVHCPLNNATKYLFNKEAFSLMKKGVYFINTARGGIINTLDLIEAVEKGIIGGAGLDVYEYEKPIFFTNHSNTPINDDIFKKLQSLSKVLITGHQAFLTTEALTGICQTTIANITEFSTKGFTSNDLN